jgi:hypothetical protein
MPYALGMRKVHAIAQSAVAAFILQGGLAAAQAPPPPSRKYKAQPLNLHREAGGLTESAERARARMKSGDCAGALDAFDLALNTSREATLYRDRGTCHEKLGQPYPAIDDYRAYLTAVPEAQDADGIRERLARLEDETSGRPARTTDDTNVPSANAGGEGEGSPVGAQTASATGRDKLQYVEPDEDVLRSSLRRGKGWSLAPFFSVRTWIGGFQNTGDSVWAECVGAQVRYSVGPGGALVFEAGFEPFNLTSTDAVTVEGLSAQIAYELRFRLDPEFDNQLLVDLGLGYEHLNVSPTNPQFAASSVGAFVPRARFGFRHLVSPSAAVDFSLDAGIANFFEYSSFPYDSNQSLTGFVAGDVSVAWGM